MFTGTYNAKLDFKNHFKIPKPFVQELKARNNNKRTLAFVLSKQGLRVYAETDMYGYYEEAKNLRHDPVQTILYSITAEFGQVSYNIFRVATIPNAFRVSVMLRSPSNIILTGCGGF